MDLMQSSEEWSRAHHRVNELLSLLLNTLRDLGYNPSYHISYDHDEHHVRLDDQLLRQHPQLMAVYRDYVAACRERSVAVQRIQELPKMDLGFDAN
ncbi:hypothetical protein [Alicyclobacillus macrosporangiidus]|jgi:hypothetical protein|uniref:Uncharacterized protein n=1 Tax=Alicyclobacillus macrosporangiidus TaxID=392015 RepID=A0A1I7FKL2_9BACL|nr:hypothetical protein [Alicyclobacillus macrosporangiidus]SFU36711.1 hypothetical protein SAMN05421543_101311 [Alicyclobacillus macrosporangiidus]